MKDICQFTETKSSIGYNGLRIKNRFNVFYTLLVADCKTFLSVGKR
jgi:hypothetical protein